MSGERFLSADFGYRGDVEIRRHATFLLSIDGCARCVAMFSPIEVTVTKPRVNASGTGGGGRRYVPNGRARFRLAWGIFVPVRLVWNFGDVTFWFGMCGDLGYR